NGGGDTLTTDYTIRAAGFVGLEEWGHVAPGFNPTAPIPADDNAGDVFVIDNVAAGMTTAGETAPAGVAVYFAGQGGDDDFINIASGNFDMTGLLSPFTIDGGAGTNHFAFS